MRLIYLALTVWANPLEYECVAIHLKALWNGKLCKVQSDTFEANGFSTLPTSEMSMGCGVFNALYLTYGILGNATTILYLMDETSLEK